MSNSATSNALIDRIKKCRLSGTLRAELSQINRVHFVLIATPPSASGQWAMLGPVWPSLDADSGAHYCNTSGSSTANM